jgi:hypothetical protein
LNVKLSFPNFKNFLVTAFFPHQGHRALALVFLALTVLGSEVVLLEVLEPVGHLPLEVLKAHEPG